jgi:hypothetical protein
MLSILEKTKESLFNKLKQKNKRKKCFSINYIRKTKLKEKIINKTKEKKRKKIHLIYK